MSVDSERRYPSRETKKTSSLIPKTGDASTRSEVGNDQFRDALCQLSVMEYQFPLPEPKYILPERSRAGEERIDLLVSATSSTS